ncbi:MAG: ribosome-recycling factor [Asgard group archaeon]|nr:ribosome-recycling factor [Asgard group archaeon]
MSKSPKSKQKFDIDVIKTPEGHVPTVESFHKVIDGLFGEVLDTRKDIVKLIPNLEKELSSLREILAQQMILFEVINNNISKLEDELKDQSKKITKIQKVAIETEASETSEAELTTESKKAIAKLVKDELKVSTKPIHEALKLLEKSVAKSELDTLKKVEKQLTNLRDQIDDLSSKTEIQMLEILESVNQGPVTRSSKSTKKKLTS